MSPGFASTAHRPDEGVDQREIEQCFEEPCRPKERGTKGQHIAGVPVQKWFSAIVREPDGSRADEEIVDEHGDAQSQDAMGREAGNPFVVTGLWGKVGRDKEKQAETKRLPDEHKGGQ